MITVGGAIEEADSAGEDGPLWESVILLGYPSSVEQPVAVAATASGSADTLTWGGMTTSPLGRTWGREAKGIVLRTGSLGADSCCWLLGVKVSVDDLRVDSLETAATFSFLALGPGKNSYYYKIVLGEYYVIISP